MEMVAQRESEEQNAATRLFPFDGLPKLKRRLLKGYAKKKGAAGVLSVSNDWPSPEEYVTSTYRIDGSSRSTLCATSNTRWLQAA